MAVDWLAVVKDIGTPVVIASIVAYFVSKATKTHEVRLSGVQDIRTRQLAELDRYWPLIVAHHRHSMTAISEGVIEIERDGLRATDVQVSADSLASIQEMIMSVYIPATASVALQEYLEFLGRLASSVQHLRDQGRPDLALAWLIEMGESMIYELKLRFREAYDITHLDAEAGKLSGAKRMGEFRVPADDIRVVLDLPRTVDLQAFEERIKESGSLLFAEQIWPGVFKEGTGDG